MKSKLSINLWVFVFVGATMFHAWRGSTEDAYIFGTATILMLTQVFGFTRFGFKEQPKLSIWVIGSVVLAVAAVLYFAPRHSTLILITLLILIPAGIGLLFYVDNLRHPKPTEAVKRSRLAWGVWAFIFTLIELIAFIGSQFANDTNDFPTISVLLDPVLETPLGRAAFVALWLMAGVYLFGFRRKR